ncbi:glycosyltransferase [Flagellimonas flava]|uniref:Glycosyl transferases group 1 n=1 Tax=Flagellimonas flava TaxID=570519 RepID=A0A1M5L1A3_9FLAO|nr:glycosyltransferase [Allomuricauda flava]SHG58766.1 Glycosyl transferases group 1 [Allomuricauda flava]
MQQNLLIVQRVLTRYRLDLFRQLHDNFGEIGIITSQGDSQGALKKVDAGNIPEKNVVCHKLSSLRLGYKGESRSTSLFFYPQAIFLLRKYDVILLEGTTNILNNFLIIPAARILGKKVIWWDAGYSPSIRTRRRKVIDIVVKPLVGLTHKQMAYSTIGGRYMQEFMGAKKVFVNLNTIRTDYFEGIQQEIETNIKGYKTGKSSIKLLYVGVIESRKKIKELADVVVKLNQTPEKKKYTIDIIGDGKLLQELRQTIRDENVVFHGPIYDKEALKSFYFRSDLFVLPGDGGLGILQSLLFGLPVICLKGADGTEQDYILEKTHLLDRFDEIYPLLESIENVDKSIYSNYLKKVSSQNWVKKFVSETTSI